MYERLTKHKYFWTQYQKAWIILISSVRGDLIKMSELKHKAFKSSETQEGIM